MLSRKRLIAEGRDMAKQVTAQIRLQVPGGQATPAPPVGPALGQHGVNIGAFVTQFNDKTKEMRGITVPVVITVYNDRSFTFEVKSPPAAVLLKQAAGIPLEKKKGGEVIPAEEKTKKSGKYKGFKVKASQVRDIAQRKFQDLNARDVDHAVHIVAGTARSMGITIEG
jgi:large subunit ribosomal protein L11